MDALELRIPPPIVALLVAVAMWAMSAAGPAIPLPWLVRVVLGAALAAAGVAFALSGAIAFRRAGTTVNPLRPEKASSLVTSGVYQWTRNPMYTGLALVLLGWAAYLASLIAFGGPVAFVLYIGRFQIAPEERALGTLFGAEYAAYRSKVRRWL